MATQNSDVLVTFTEEQSKKLAELRDTGQYADGYRYIRDIVHEARVAYTGNVPPTTVYLFGDEHAKELIKLETWISYVVGINSGDNSAYSEFVRGSTKVASLLQGKPISEATFQLASDKLAMIVIDDALAHGGMLSAGDVVNTDVTQALENLGLPPAGWAGVLGDVFPPPLGFGENFVQVSDPADGLLPFLGGLTAALTANLVGGVGRLAVDIVLNKNGLVTNTLDLLLTGILDPVHDARTVNGSILSDHLYGGYGNDHISGGKGNDWLYGKDGDDILDGGTGADKMYGGGNNDTYIVDNIRDEVHENYGEGLDTVQSSVSYTLAKNVEYLVLTGKDNIVGTGNELNNFIAGNDGSNVLRGEAGNDILSGGAGNDMLFGGEGNDVLIGGLGVDQLSGGEGADTFIFNSYNESRASSPDWITDFVSGTDKIDLSVFNTGEGLQQITFVSAFSGKAGEATLTYDKATNVSDLAINMGGDFTSADFLVKIVGHPLQQVDFIV
ncbi:calcium-binding protein [Serratia inhibens]|uniref:calcium-binding protein n=1 Tax=Serratia inhibens TaxID=2338073 RepID=UPI00025E2B76|nr:calcium-binding protein [Serratia inhibens]ANS44117.1 Serralysin [Serratia inhibens PRI-2C]